uniref:Ig-like domain-containing protein n=1 Tax=Nothobranchius furzeri TaxID=105023 RepID=A0A1A7ZY85_NOTFU
MTFLRLSAGYLFFLLFVSAGCPAPADPIVKIIAFANETAILPCHIDPSDDLPTVEWSKENISPNITFLYRGCSCMSSCTNACVITGAVTFVVTGVCVLLMLCGNAVCGCWIKKLAKEQTIYNLNAEISYFTSKLEPAPQRGQPPSTSISTPPSTNQEDQLPQSITLKPAASSTSIHRESDHKSKVKDSQQAVPKHPAPGPKVKENNPKSAAFPFPKGGAAPSSPHPPPIPEGSTCSRSLSFSGPYSSSGRLLRRPSMSNRYSVLVNLTEDKESLLK